MRDLIRIAVPEIEENWEDFAYELYYDSIVNDIREQCNGDPQKCCKKVLFEMVRQ